VLLAGVAGTDRLRKNLFDLCRVAVVHNLHVIAPPGRRRRLPAVSLTTT
jgi:hypothetical protein